MSLRIYDVRGRLVTTLLFGASIPGTHTTMWNGHNDIGQSVASGVYFYSLRATGFDVTKKLVLTK